jgi:hypothetical protein
MVLLDSHGIPRAPRYSGTLKGRHISFAYRTFTYYGPPFQGSLARTMLCNFPAVWHDDHPAPHYPVLSTHASLQQKRFGLLPFRSPLLRQSRLFSLPRGTWMFRFPPLASVTYEFSHGNPASRMGCPIRKSPDQCVFATPRGLSQLTTSFVASQCQGIRHIPFISWRKSNYISTKNVLHQQPKMSKIL